MIEALLKFFKDILKKANAIYSEKPETPAWFTIAERELGTKEMLFGENQRIVEYHSVTSLEAKEDEVPWCASFVSWCLEQVKIPSTKSARAKSYLKWGTSIPKPRLGCIVVFNRIGGGHVAFYVNSTPTKVLVLGGNQGNAVSIAEYKLSDVLDYRWPIES